ncbi:hypothetical protein AGOR_G00244070 [Albula goreensis]|uniref:TGF-beta family profile domain-containing protein n=1 Tax=Albula goreensis TaxID=1534307 RepID=A0A8T3CE87_9TELE|nr:hypothetical protein AGOR_G00244070 [Albula goreensis]
MRLWKWVIALMLCAAALTGLLSRTTLPPWALHHTRSPKPSSSSSAPSSLSSPNRESSSSSFLSPSPRTHGRRSARATDGFSALLTEFNYMLRSFTEGEMKQLIATLVERTTARRTKRARNGLKLGVCRLREVQVSVTQLGLGYESEEVVSFKYCSGRCSSRRRNYDLTLKNVQSAGFVKDRPNRACCRPLQYEDKFSFLGDDNKPYTIRKLSALQCGCV